MTFHYFQLTRIQSTKMPVRPFGPTAKIKWFARKIWLAVVFPSHFESMFVATTVISEPCCHPRPFGNLKRQYNIIQRLQTSLRLANFNLKTIVLHHPFLIKLKPPRKQHSRKQNGGSQTSPAARFTYVSPLLSWLTIFNGTSDDSYCIWGWLADARNLADAVFTLGHPYKNAKEAKQGWIWDWTGMKWEWSEDRPEQPANLKARRRKGQDVKQGPPSEFHSTVDVISNVSASFNCAWEDVRIRLAFWLGPSLMVCFENSYWRMIRNGSEAHWWLPCFRMFWLCWAVTTLTVCKDSKNSSKENIESRRTKCTSPTGGGKTFE